MRNWLINTKPKQLEYYKDILIHADANVHEQAAALFERYIAHVLDIGAGAFAPRLADMGYAVIPLEVDPQKWRAPEMPFLKLNIDTGIAGMEKPAP